MLSRLQRLIWRPISDDVPWLNHERDDVILLKDGSVLTLTELGGVSTSTMDLQDVALLKQALNRSWVQLSNPAVTVSVWQHRGLASPDVYPDIPTDNEFATSLNLSYKARLLDRMLYSNRLFIAVQMRPPAYVRMEKRFRRTDDVAAELMTQLDDFMVLLFSELSSYQPRKIGIRVSEGIVFSEIAETLVMLTTGRWRPIGVPYGLLGEAAYTEHVSFKQWDCIKFISPAGVDYAAVLGFMRYPASSNPFMLAPLLTCNYRCTVRHTFRFIPTPYALNIIDKTGFIAARAGDPALAQRAKLPTLAGELSDGLAVLGEYSISVLVFADTEHDLEKASAGAFYHLAEKTGATIAREKLGRKPTWLSMIPGNERLHPRTAYAASYNFASLAPLHRYRSGQMQGHWGGPIAMLRSLAGTPVYFHWHQDDTGNTLVTGQIGSGKTTLIAFLLAMTSARARIIGLDHKRGWQFLFQRMGGDYTVLGNGRPNFAPLRSLSSSPDDLAFLFDLIRGSIMSDDAGQLTPDEERRLALGIRMVMTLPPEQREMWDIRTMLGVTRNGAGARLEKWCWGHELGWVIDAPRDAISLSGRLTGLDTTSLLTNTRACQPALLYLFYRIRQAQDGTPTLVPVDEGWRVPFNDTFAQLVEEQIRIIRSKNGLFVFITQGFDEVLQAGRLAKVLVEQCPTQLHLPNPRASESDFITGLKRSRGEFEVLKGLRLKSGYFLLCQGNESMPVQLDLHDMDDFRAVLSAPEKALTEHDKALA